MRSFHKQSRTKPYFVWKAMKGRCYNKNDKRYPFYGGRGIIVCDSWLKSFDNFIKDLGIRPDGYYLDRIDNNGNYCPENCKWSTGSTSARNSRKPTAKSKYRGIYLNKNKSKIWTARITINYKKLFLGNFETEIEAAKAYDAALIKYCAGEGIFNFPK